MTSTVDPARLVGGRYILEKLIGEGGTGEVWKARHVTLQSPVAIKLLHGSAAFRESTRKRFLTEARVAAQLSTRHAVKVFDFGVTEQGRPYLIMELLDGETLANRLEREKVLTPYATARILRLTARALDAAHALGVVHRDFKPENIFLVRTEEEGEEGEDVKVVDFGVAKLVGELEIQEEDEEPTSTRQNEQSFVSFTRTGRSVGTPCYMAPEQATAKIEITAAADVWAIGVVAYECLTGFRPFVAADIATLFTRIEHGTHVPATERNPSLPKNFDPWFRKACAPNPHDRFASASGATLEFIEALEIQKSTLFGDGDNTLNTLTLRGELGLSGSIAQESQSSSSVPAASRSNPTDSAQSGETQGETGFRARRLSRRAWLVAVVLLGLGIAAGSWWHFRSVPSAPIAASSTEVPSSTGSDSSEERVLDAHLSEAAPDVFASTTSVPQVASGVPEPHHSKESKLPSGRAPERPAQTATTEPSSSPPTTATQEPDKPHPTVTSPPSPFELPDLGL